MLKANSRLLRGYSIALATCLVAFGLTQVLPQRQSILFPIFLGVVLLSTRFGGLGPGLAATGLSSLAMHFMFMTATGWGRPGFAGGIQLAAFLLVAVLMGALTARISRQRERLRATLESIGEGVIITDTSGRVSSMNPLAQSLTGWSLKDALGRPLPEVFRAIHDPSSRRPLPGPTIEPSREEAGERRGDRALLLARDGRETPIEQSAAPIRDDRGTVLGMVLVFSDRTESRQAEASLRRSEWELADFFENAVIGLHWVGHDGTILKANRAVLELLGYSGHEYVGRNISDFHADREAVLDVLERLRGGEAISGQEGRLVARDGSIKHVLIDSNTYRENGRFIHTRWFVRDITRRKAAELELEQAKEAAEAASRARDQFLAVLSHELRAPLTPVLMKMAEIESRPDLSPEVRSSLEIIRRNVEMEARLIDDLLDLTRITRGDLELDPRPVDAHALVRNALEICRGELQSRRIALGVELESARHHVRADPGRLQQVFWNLVKNAIKFTHLEGKVVARSRETGGGLEVQVIDSGIGIDEKQLSRIFNAFDHADRSVVRRFGGLGVGLAISRALVEAQGGTLTAQSPGKGRGSTFTVTFPLVEAPAQGGMTCEANGNVDRPTLRILLAEDNQDTALVMVQLLSGLNYHVKTASTVESALQMAEKEPFDLLISDLGLPDGSGLGLMRRLREQMPIKGIALSGFGMDSDLKKSKEAGFMEHLTKPVDFQRLARAIQKALS